MRKHISAALIVSSASAVAIVFVATTAHAENTPSERPGISADGTIDPAKAPKKAPVVGPDGQLEKDAFGRVQQRQTGFGLPPPPGQVRADGLAHQIIKDKEGRSVEIVDVPPVQGSSAVLVGDLAS